jgi:hypothetical protein
MWLAPVLAVTDRLRTSARLAVLMVALLVPGLVATVAYTKNINGQIDFSADEQVGTKVVEPALLALADTVAGRTPDLTALKAAASANPSLELGKVMAAVDPAAARTDLAPALAAVVTEAGNTSNLILDPDLDSFYVMDIQIVQLPKLLVSAALAASPKQGAGNDVLVGEQAVHAGELSGAANAIRSDVQTAVANTSLPGLADRLKPLEAAADATATLAKALTDTLAKPGPGDPAPAADAVKSAVSATVSALDVLLARRIDGLSGGRTVTLAVTVCGLLASRRQARRHRRHRDRRGGSRRAAAAERSGRVRRHRPRAGHGPAPARRAGCGAEAGPGRARRTGAGQFPPPAGGRAADAGPGAERHRRIGDRHRRRAARRGDAGR